MSNITTHVLDTVLGKPAAGIAVRLESEHENSWDVAGSSITDADGRCRNLAENCGPGLYRLVFATDAYFRSKGVESIYPEISVTFNYDGKAHYHLPLLLSVNSYTTYRGS
jgi:5-hydroxyisourate hydrolase